MDTHTFKIGDAVRATHGPSTDPCDTTGVVEKHHDWWTMVRMSRSQILMPFMEGELSHADAGHTGNDRSSAVENTRG